MECHAGRITQWSQACALRVKLRKIIFSSILFHQPIYYVNEILITLSTRKVEKPEFVTWHDEFRKKKIESTRQTLKNKLTQKPSQ